MPLAQQAPANGEAKSAEVPAWSVMYVSVLPEDRMTTDQDRPRRLISLAQGLCLCLSLTWARCCMCVRVLDQRGVGHVELLSSLTGSPETILLQALAVSLRPFPPAKFEQ